MATKITSYNPCKNDPYGASSMPIYQVRRKRESAGYVVVRRQRRTSLCLLA